MPYRAVILLCLAAVPVFPAVVRSVRVEGTGASVPLQTKVNQELDPAALTSDVQALWSTGALEDIRVEQAAAEDGSIDVVFKAREKPRVYLDKVEFSKRSPNRRVEFQPGAVIDNDKARALARNLEKQLREEGYAHGHVHFDLVPTGYKRANLMFDVDEGDRYTVWGSRFAGAPALSPEDLNKALRATRVKRIAWGLFHSRPGYSEDAVDADIQRLRSLYTTRGFLDARITIGDTEFHGDHVELTYNIDAGRKYNLGGPSGQLPVREICSCAFRARRQADSEGRQEFEPRVWLTPRPAGGFGYQFDYQSGDPWYVGRINFSGNHKLSDTVLRQALVLDEGDPFDQTRLGRSLVRLNRLGLLENVSERNVHVTRSTATRTVVLDIVVKEPKGGRWTIAGPAGTVRMGGPFQGGVMGRLPGWGRGMFELPTYFAAVSVFAFGNPFSKLLPFVHTRSWMPYVSLQRPWLAGQGWTSGFTLSPQIGLKGMAAMYAAGQLQGRTKNLLMSDKPKQPPIAVPVERAGAEAPAMILCEERTSRLYLLRAGVAMAAEFFLFARPF